MKSAENILKIVLVPALLGVILAGKQSASSRMTSWSTATDIDAILDKSGVIANDKTIPFANENHTWRIALPYGSRLVFQFLSINFGQTSHGLCRSDYVAIYEEAATGDVKLIAKQCAAGDTLSRQFNTSATTTLVFVSFRTDQTVGRNHSFELEWNRLDPDDLSWNDTASNCTVYGADDDLLRADDGDESGSIEQLLSMRLAFAGKRPIHPHESHSGRETPTVCPIFASCFPFMVAVSSFICGSVVVGVCIALVVARRIKKERELRTMLTEKRGSYFLTLPF